MRAAVLLLAPSLFLAGSLPSAVAASSEKSDSDLAISKVVAQCRGLLPSKKVGCIKTKMKELVGDSIDECSKEPIGSRLSCMDDRIRYEAGKVEGLILVAHLTYQSMHGRDASNSVLGNAYQIARIRANPFVLLEDKELRAGLEKDLKAVVAEMKGVDGNGDCRPDASLIGKLNCLKAEYIDQATAKKVVTWAAYAQVLVVYAADRFEVSKDLAGLQGDLAQVAGDPKKLADQQLRTKILEEMKTTRKHAWDNLDFWHSYGEEVLADLRAARTDIEDLKKSAEGSSADTGNSDGFLSGVGGPEWDKTFKKLDEGFSLGSDWDKTFGPNGSMQKTFGPNGSMQKTIKELEQTNKELEQTAKNLARTNRELTQMSRDLDQMNKSIDAGMKSIDLNMADLRDDVAEMRKIQNRKHPEVWDNLYKDLDLSSIPEYVHGGPMPQDDKVKALITSALMDITPGLGDAKGIAELLTGHDSVTEDKLSVPERLVGAVIVTREAKAARDLMRANDLRKAIKATEKLSRQFPEAARQHVLKGEIKFGKNGQARVTGYHVRPGGKDRPGVKVPKITQRDPKTGLTRGEVWMKNPRDGQWIKKRAQSTFFPETWTFEQADRAIGEAFERATVVDTGTNRWQSTYKGIKIEGYYDPETGHALTAYPIFPDS
ncbi:EndoU domain-containing protein [Streptomyces sp. NPDC020883]|uniref:EndoU domain-containing protein n=1 Tax=Streptomyces sp. NPDC020883 TaxID=3365099 RepID=UPI0037A88DBF